MSDNAGKRITADGPVTLAVMNPKMVERFKDRLCETCETPIMDHWIIPNDDLELATNYWCDKAGTQCSAGLKV